MYRNQKEVYCFIYDSNRKYYRAVQQLDGSYLITKNSEAYPLKFSPDNIGSSPVEFSTNAKYMSMVRSIIDPLRFIKDGAAILRDFYFLRSGVAQYLYLTVIEWDGLLGYYVLSYNGKFDFSKKTENPATGEFSIPLLDDSAWGSVSRNDSTQYSLDCSISNPKSVPVLFDAVTLNSIYTFQTIPNPVRNRRDYSRTNSLVLVNTDGDSSGLVVKSQVQEEVYNGNLLDYITTSVNSLIYSFFATTINISGDIILSFSHVGSGNPTFSIAFVRSSDPTHYRYIVFAIYPVEGQAYKYSFSFDIPLNSGERIFMFTLDDAYSGASGNFIYSYTVTNIFIKSSTQTQPVVRYGLRSLDLIKGLVSKASRGRYTVESDYLSLNNNFINFSGDAIRGVQYAKIYSSIFDFYKSHDAWKFMTFRNIDNELYFEQVKEVYKTDTLLLDLGNIISLELEPASEMYAREIEVGSPDVDLRHPSGRLEFNTQNSFSFPFDNIDNKIDAVSKYRTGCYEILFLILDYNAQSTVDNIGDKEVHTVEITDEMGTASTLVSTFENFNVDNATLAPIIKYPLNNYVLRYDKPLIKGVGIPGNTVNIFVFTVLDGSTVIDGNGDWSYNINTALIPYNPGVESGISDINATYTNLIAPVDTISVTVDLTIVSPLLITYPTVSQSLYNNKPLIRGVAPNGTNIDISINGVLIASVTADNSCGWSYKLTTPMVNGINLISINAGAYFIYVTVNSFTEFPLITYIGSELDNFPIVNNTPLVEGVATPGTNVTLWLNYISYGSIGNTIADSNGNWSFQTIPVNYVDPVSHAPVPLVPIRNGLNVLSTSLINHNVSIDVTGYKLKRPAFDSITGVPDNTVFNTGFSPKRGLLERKPLLSAIMNQQRNKKIIFETSKKNSALRTVLGSEVIDERADVPYSSLGSPLFLLERASIKTDAIHSFAKVLNHFNNGGKVKGNYRGIDLYFMPIGEMKMESLRDSVQSWKLLLAPENTYISLLNLYKNGLTINLMNNAIFHSDYNSLHAVNYGFTPNAKYNSIDIYEDWFRNRNSAWIENPKYIQKYQTSDGVIKDQIITRGVSSVTLRAYKAINGNYIETIQYNVVSPAPINIPEIVLEAEIDLTHYEDMEVFFVMFVDEDPVSIFEPIYVKAHWINTILIEASNSVNKPGFFYSTGYETVIRTEGLIKKYQPSVDSDTSVDFNGDAELLYSRISKMRSIRFGTALGLPDFLYLKVAYAVTLDNCIIDNILYTIAKDERIEPADEAVGIPMFYYNINMLINNNNQGKVFSAGSGSDLSGVILTVDSEAIGLPAGSLVNIELNNE